MLYDFGKRSPLEACLTKSVTKYEVDCEDLSATPELIETILALEVTEGESILEEVKKTLDGLVPKGLKYAFLEHNEKKLVIISSQLDNDMEVKLLGVLKKNFEEFSWSIDDIKGIGPSKCMHKIMIKEDHAPSIEHQRRLNLAMKEVMKREVLKWLQVGFI